MSMKHGVEITGGAHTMEGLCSPPCPLSPRNHERQASQKKKKKKKHRNDAIDDRQ
jgi:hypothetical protein